MTAHFGANFSRFDAAGGASATDLIERGDRTLIRVAVAQDE